MIYSKLKKKSSAVDFFGGNNIENQRVRLFFIFPGVLRHFQQVPSYTSLRFMGKLLVLLVHLSWHQQVNTPEWQGDKTITSISA